MLDKGALFTNTAGGTFRLLAVTKVGSKDVAHVFGMDERKALPDQWDFAELKAGLKAGEYKKSPSRGLPVVVKVRDDTCKEEEELSPAETLRDWRYGLIKPLLAKDRIFWRKHRGKLVADRAEETSASEQTIMTCLRLYWRGGMTPDALLGGFDRCGTPQGPDNSKPQATRGRKPRDERYVKYGMSAAEQKKVISTAMRFFKRKKTNTRHFVYRRVVAAHYSVQQPGGKKVPLPLGQRPTRAQVLHLLDKHLTLETVMRRKLGDDNFEKDVEPQTGSARAYANGIGQYYEIDSTIPDVWICAEDDPATVIGKATLYLIVDVFSRLIVGFHLTLDRPSWQSALEAMMSLVEDKRELCERWEFAYREEDWLAHGYWPAFFRADRGSEFTGYDSDTIADNLETGITQAPKRKANRKGTVECSFKLVHVPLKDHVGGYTPPADMGHRQTDDQRGAATRTLKSVAQEVLAAIRLSNSKVHKGIKLPAADVYKNLQPIPTELWKRDLEERAGMLTRYPADYLRFKLLPSSDKFTVTSGGVFFKGLLWEPPTELKKHWLLPATRGTYSVSATFHRNLVNHIYVHDPKDPTKWTTMHLSDRCLDHLGKTFADTEYLNDARLTLEQLADEHNLALEIQNDEEAIAREKTARVATKAALHRAAGRSRTSGAAEKREVEAKRARVKTKVLETTAVVSGPAAQRAAPPRGASAPMPAPATPTQPAASPKVATVANTALQSLLNLRKKS